MKYDQPNLTEKNEFIDFLDDRIATRLCESIIFNLQISEGIQLVASIGNGNESDNREAIINWIKNQNLADRGYKANELLSILEGRLVNTLSELKTRHFDN